jgi:hypothetical protein
VAGHSGGASWHCLRRPFRHKLQEILNGYWKDIHAQCNFLAWCYAFR